MARPRKTGLDYFPFDVGFFENEKISCIAGEFGIKGEIAVIKLLCAIYRNGYFIEWNEKQQMTLLRQLPGISSELLDQIVRRLVRWGFFSASLFDSDKVLTSVGIQERYFEVTKRCQRIGDFPYLLVNVTLTPINATLTPVNVTLIPQIKENKIKETPKGVKKGDEENEGIGNLFDGVKKPEEPKKNKPGFTPPTLDDVLAYFEQHPDRSAEWDLDARLFFSYYESRGWRHVRRWDSSANYWILKNTKRKNENRQTPDRFSERRGTEPRNKERKDFKATL